MVEPGAAAKFQRFLSLQVLYPNFRSGVSSSVYLGATRGRAWVRLVRIKSPTKKRFQVFKKNKQKVQPIQSSLKSMQNMNGSSEHRLLSLPPI